MMLHALVRPAAVALVLLAAVPFTSAAISDPAVLITATNANGTATLSIPMSAFTYYPEFGEWDYTQVGITDMFTPGHQYVARVEALSAFLIDDPTIGPSITLQYTVIAGTSLTNFTIDAETVSFNPIPASLAAANMSDTLNLTDLNGNAYAWCSALDNYAYKTYYGQAGSPNEFFFHGSDAPGPLGFGTTSQGGVIGTYTNWPETPGEYENLGVSVDRIRTQAGFSLTQQDKLQVQTGFGLNFIPEPSTALAAVCGLLLLRRR